jgi:purine-binding chemotaxis protein CheW
VTVPSSVIEYVTFRVEEQWLGIPVLTVQEVLLPQTIADVPLSPPEVAGFLNLRGQIVTALDLRIRLDFATAGPAEPAARINVVVRHEGELFSLLVDEVGDVLAVERAGVEPTPRTLPPAWRQLCSGIVSRDGELLVVLNVDAILRLDSVTA